MIYTSSKAGCRDNMQPGELKVIMDFLAKNFILRAKHWYVANFFKVLGISSR